MPMDNNEVTLAIFRRIEQIKNAYAALKRAKGVLSYNER